MGEREGRGEGGVEGGETREGEMEGRRRREGREG